MGLVVTHVEKCDLCQVCCPLGCGHSSQRKNSKRHEQEECPERDTSCELCQTSIKFSQTRVHFETCPNFPLKCSNGCNQDRIVRKDLSLHLSEICPLTLVPCAYKKYGCVDVKRVDVDTHEMDSVVKHVRMMSTQIESLTSRNELMNTQIESLTSRNELMNTQIESLTSRNESNRKVKSFVAIYYFSYQYSVVLYILCMSKSLSLSKSLVFLCFQITLLYASVVYVTVK